MTALLIAAHGSRLAQSNNEVIDLADKLRHSGSVKYDLVQTAFLELSGPFIAEGIRSCIAEGATSITVFPYFLNSGRHVIRDIPDRVGELSRQYPDVTIRIVPHLGASPLLTELMIGLVNALPESCE